MTFIKCLLLSLLLSLCAGCQFIPTERQQTTVQEEGEQTTVSINPYLSSQASITSEARQRFTVAKQAVQKQQWQQAEQELLWLVEHYPQLSGPYVNLALLYQQPYWQDQNTAEESSDQPLPSRVEQMFEQAIAANNNNLTAHRQYGLYLRGEGRFKAAEEQYLNALAIWPDDAEAHRNLGILYDLYLGQLDKALHHYQQCQNLLPSPDKQLKNWIVDLRRRLPAQQEVSQNEA